MGFDQSLSFGQAGESEIARWLRAQGWAVLPVYEKILDTGKGPHVFLPHGSAVAPDMLTWRGQRVVWIEAKHKRAFTWHRKTARWVTGIDLHHYEEYQRVAAASPWRVALYFLHLGGQAKDSPADSPSGLYAGWLDHLRQRENHRHQNWGRTGMVYWAEQTLAKIAELHELRRAVAA